MNIKNITPINFKGAPQTARKVMPNGDTYSLEYNNGELIRAEKQGQNPYIKTYIETDDERIVERKEGYKVRIFNITKIQDAVNASQDEVRYILENYRNMPLSEIQKRRAKIRYINSKQSQRIDRIITIKKYHLEEILDRPKSDKPKGPYSDYQKCQKNLKKFREKLQTLPDCELDVLLEKISTIEDKINEGIPPYDNLSKYQKETGLLYQLQRKSAIGYEKIRRQVNYLDSLLHKPEDNLIPTGAKSKSVFNYVKRYGMDGSISPQAEELINYTRIHDYDSSLRLGIGAKGSKPWVLDDVFKRVPALKQDSVVFRAVYDNGQGKELITPNGIAIENRAKFIESIKEGAIIQNKGFTSASTACDSSFLAYAKEPLNGNGVLMRIKLPKGTKPLIFTNEILLPRDSKIKANKLETVEGIKIADCEYIL